MGLDPSKKALELRNKSSFPFRDHEITVAPCRWTFTESAPFLNSIISLEVVVGVMIICTKSSKLKGYLFPRHFD